jgi:20S proteasome alpha/beta subunit
MTSIKDAYHASMTIAEAQKLTLQTLKNVMEEKIDATNVEVLCIRTDTRKMEYM